MLNNQQGIADSVFLALGQQAALDVEGLGIRHQSEVTDSQGIHKLDVAPVIRIQQVVDSGSDWEVPWRSD